LNDSTSQRLNEESAEVAATAVVPKAQTGKFAQEDLSGGEEETWQPQRGPQVKQHVHLEFWCLTTDSGSDIKAARKRLASEIARQEHMLMVAVDTMEGARDDILQQWGYMTRRACLDVDCLEHQVEIINKQQLHLVEDDLIKCFKLKARPQGWKLPNVPNVQSVAAVAAAPANPTAQAEAAAAPAPPGEAATAPPGELA